ncbi:MAG: hypothetical protein AB1476_00085 [Candidatus Hadarchaeota archaeon]
MRCPRCDYQWEPKVPNPKECPRCKVRLDYVPGPVGAPRIKKLEKEVRKGMSSRIPWVAATLIIVVAAGLGAWMLSTPLTTTIGNRVEGWGGAVSTTAGWTPLHSTSGPLATYGAVNSVGWASLGGTDNVGIENIYILDFGAYGIAERDDNTGTGTPAYRMGIISGNGGNVNIPYENTFAIIVGVKAKAPDNLAYVRRENLQVDVKFVFPGETEEENSGNFESDPEMGIEYQRSVTGENTTSGFIWVNAYWDNLSAGYTLGAGYSLDIQRVTLWTWK